MRTALATALLALALGAQTAHAGVVSRSGEVVRYAGSDGADVVGVTTSAGTVVVTASPPPQAGEGCHPGADANSVRCDQAGVTSLDVATGGGADDVTVDATLPATASLGPGDDRFGGGAEADHVDGGDGADTVTTGAGDDRVITLDGRANGPVDPRPQADTSDCGGGADSLVADRADSAAASCEVLAPRALSVPVIMGSPAVGATVSVALPSFDGRPPPGEPEIAWLSCPDATWGAAADDSVPPACAVRSRATSMVVGSADAGRFLTVLVRATSLAGTGIEGAAFAGPIPSPEAAAAPAPAATTPHPSPGRPRPIRCAQGSAMPLRAAFFANRGANAVERRDERWELRWTLHRSARRFAPEVGAAFSAWTALGGPVTVRRAGAGATLLIRAGRRSDHRRSGEIARWTPSPPRIALFALPAARGLRTAAIAHEIGHALGLGHSCDDQLMAPTATALREHGTRGPRRLDSRAYRWLWRSGRQEDPWSTLL